MLESDDEAAEMDSDSETDVRHGEHPVCRPTRRGGHDSAHCQRSCGARSQDVTGNQ